MPVRRSAAGRWPCRTFSRPSGVTGSVRPSSIFSASSRAVISSTPLPVTMSRSTPASRVPRRRSGRAVRACSVDHARAGLRVGGARDRGEREQRRDVADGVAPRGVDERRADDDVGGRRRSACAVIRIVRAPFATARRLRARLSVAAVPASCETAMHTPPCCGSSDASNASRAMRAGDQRRAGHRGVLAGAAADEHDRPALADRLGRLDRAGRRQDRRDQPGSAWIISSIAHGGPSRSSGMSLMAGDGTVRVACGQGHFDASRTVPLWSSSPPLDRSRPEPLRAQLEDAICAAITGGGAPPGTRLPASRVARRVPARVPRGRERGVRADRRRGLDRGPPRRRAGRPRGAGRPPNVKRARVPL